MHVIILYFSAWFYCKACHEDIKDETLIKKCKCKNCKSFQSYLRKEISTKNLIDLIDFLHNWIIICLCCPSPWKNLTRVDAWLNHKLKYGISHTLISANHIWTNLVRTSALIVTQSTYFRTFHKRMTYTLIRSRTIKKFLYQRKSN